MNDESEAPNAEVGSSAAATPARAATSGLARLMLAVGAVLFLATGAMYVAVPAVALDILDIEATSTTEFLLRTQGIAVLFGGLLLLVAIAGRMPAVVLLALAAYLVAASVVDVVAFVQGIAGPATVPAAITRIGLGVLCGAVAVRRNPARSAR